MPTPRQEKLAEAIIDNSISDKPISKGELLMSVGYAATTSVKKPGEILANPGVQEALEAKGFTVENAKMVVASIMLDDSQDASSRLKATDQTFKVHGAYAAEKQVVRSINVNVETEPEGLTAFLAEKEQELIEKFG